MIPKALEAAYKGLMSEMYELMPDNHRTDIRVGAVKFTFVKSKRALIFRHAHYKTKKIKYRKHFQFTYCNVLK